MTNFNPTRQLAVYRTLSTGQKVLVGELAQNKQGVYFQYQSDYLEKFDNLSPFRLQANSTLQLALAGLHGGLHGVFADSLPDGWGLLLQDRYFRSKGIAPSQVTAMDRLAFVGQSAMGALSYEPYMIWQSENNETSFAQLGLQAQAVFDGQTDEVLQTLIAAGSSGGARPKAQLYSNSDLTKFCRTIGQKGDDAWLIKFTSHQLALGHDEGICEAVYLTMAQIAGIQTTEWKLLSAPKESGANAWLAVKRFDWLPANAGRLHLLSAAGLLDADFRLPSLDYIDLIKASKILTKDTQASKQQFLRAMFNLFAANQDDHSKNWAFLQQDNAQWQLSPFYDATFSPQKFGEHATAFLGQGKQPALKTIQKLADIAGFDSWSEARIIIRGVVDALSMFQQYAKNFGVSKNNIRLIQQYLDDLYKQNRQLLE
ncbi:phosphatidylinositol kinase [Pelistega indica]|uniref:Phosphatidylinositol kinase n=1 Tax=Pelistega indica TaxID=1414851 RepID=V8FTB6_9BURK|nr:type II toxin-antitoxin system HipA family toxin [Pelistega indica]ETD67131.1 phosphatidylinositol kinase [Pelistega indica]